MSQTGKLLGVEMSFLIDYPLLVVIGIVAVWLNNRFFSKFGKYSLHVIFVIIIAIFWGVSISMYLNLFPVPPYESGTEFMLNSWVFQGLNNTENTATVDMLATFVFAAYPVWLFVGVLLGLKIFEQE